MSVVLLLVSSVNPELKINLTISVIQGKPSIKVHSFDAFGRIGPTRLRMLALHVLTATLLELGILLGMRLMQQGQSNSFKPSRLTS